MSPHRSTPPTAFLRPTRRRFAAFAVALLSMVAVDLAAPTSANAAPAVAAPPTVWTTVINDTFDTGGVPTYWRAYNGPYGSGAKSCAVPSHNTVSGGYLHLKMFYEPLATAGKCGAAWYSGGLSLNNDYSAVSQRITTRFRVVQTGGVSSHRIIPMRWPDAGSGGGEEDYCEGDPVTYCSTFLHWRDWAGRDRMKYFFDLTQWHVLQTTRDGYNIKVTIDGAVVFAMVGNATSLPPTMKHIVLQQECSKGGCPLGKTGMEDIQIDSIRVENPGAVPLNAVTGISPTVLNAANSAGPLTVEGVSSGASSVSVTVTDGADTTAAVTTTPTGASGSQTWSVDVDSIDALADGVLTAAATYQVGGVKVNGPSQTVLKDTRAPQPPQTNLASGTYFGTRSVTLTHPDEAGVIYYTLDGTVPSATSTKYANPVVVSSSKTLRAIAIDTAGNASGLTTLKFLISGGLAMVAPNLLAASDSGASTTDNVTSSTTLSFAGAAPVGSTVRLFINALEAGSAVIGTSATYSFPAVAVAEGPATATISATDSSGRATPMSAATPVKVDTTPPTLAASPAGGTYTSAQSVVLTPNEAAAITYSFVPDGSAPIAPAKPYSTPLTLTEPGQLTAFAVDPAGNTGPTLDEVYSITPADPPPAVVAPTATLSGATNLGLADEIRTTVVWSATDADGVQSYMLQKRTNGGAWTTVGLSAPLNTWANLMLKPGYTYQFQVRATDVNGNVSSFSAGRPFALSIVQDDPSSSVSFTGETWTDVAATGASGGSVRQASSADHTVSLSFSGDSISWVARRGPVAGTAQVAVDGAAPVSIDLYAAAVSYKAVVFKQTMATGGDHTVTITASGTGRTASTGSVVNIDAFCVLTVL